MSSSFRGSLQACLFCFCNILRCLECVFLLCAVQDYTGQDVTVSNFFAAILGDKSGIEGGSGKVVDSGPNDHIFIYYTDHGGPGVLGMFLCFHVLQMYLTFPLTKDCFWSSRNALGDITYWIWFFSVQPPANILLVCHRYAHSAQSLCCWLCGDSEEEAWIWHIQRDGRHFCSGLHRCCASRNLHRHSLTKPFA